MGYGSLLRIYTWWRSERNCLNIFLSLERLNALDSWNGEIITRFLLYIPNTLHKRGEFTFVGLKLKNSARLLRWRLADSKGTELVDDLTLRSIDDIQLMMMMTTSTATSEKHEQTSRACASKTSRKEKRDEVEKKSSESKVPWSNTLRVDYIPFVSWGDEQTKRQLNSSNWTFFYHFPCLHSDIVPVRDRRCSCRPSDEASASFAAI